VLLDDDGVTVSHGARERGDGGQSLAEFALVFPIMIFVLVAFVEMGRAVHAYTTITNAARQGARVAVVNQIVYATECDTSRPIEDPADAHWSVIGCAVTAGATLGLDTSDVSLSFASPPDTALSCSPTLRVGCLASVTVDYQFTPITPLVSSIIGPISMSSTSEMPIERVFP
jgi:Flp pilus assembly protein TadG